MDFQLIFLVTSDQTNGIHMFTDSHPQRSNLSSTVVL